MLKADSCTLGLQINFLPVLTSVYLNQHPKLKGTKKPGL